MICLDIAVGVPMEDSKENDVLIGTDHKYSEEESNCKGSWKSLENKRPENCQNQMQDPSPNCSQYESTRSTSRLEV